MRLAVPALRAFPALLLAGCTLAPPSPEDWMDVGFRSPAQTFRTFQTALRADEPLLEYLSLSQSFKAREGLNQIVYRSFREELFDEEPWLRRAACAEILEVRELGPARARIVARVEVLFVERTFAVDLVREDFYEIHSPDGLLEDGFASFERSVDVSPEAVVCRLPLSTPLAADGLSEVRVGREWKIDGFPAAAEPAVQGP